MTSEAYLNLSREDLYELVWSKPMPRVGQRSRAVRCRARQALPQARGAGSRARLLGTGGGGQEPHRPKLAKREGRVTDDITLLSFAPVPEESPPAEASDLAPEEAAIRAQIDALSVAAVSGLESASPPIQRLARVHKVLLAKDIAWVRQTDRQGPILKIQVSEAQTLRALLILPIPYCAAPTPWAGPSKPSNQKTPGTARESRRSRSACRWALSSSPASRSRSGWMSPEAHLPRTQGSACRNDHHQQMSERRLFRVPINAGYVAWLVERHAIG